MLALTTVLTALPTLMQAVGKGGGISTLVSEIVGSFRDRPDQQAVIKAEIDRLAVDNDAGHARLQAKLAAASQR